MDKPIVISLGGSLIVPEKIDVEYLKKFREFILEYIEKGFEFLMVAGGGKTCRIYQDAARKVVDLADEDVDWIGIHVSRLNAALLVAIFRNKAHLKVLTNYKEKEKIAEPLVIAAGWKPGHSTDYDSVMFALSYGTDTVINLTDINFVYDKDPDKFPEAQPLERLTWSRYRKMAGNKWNPGKHLPFDPIASKEAERLGIKAVIINGRNLENLKNFLNGNPFERTIIS